MGPAGALTLILGCSTGGSEVETTADGPPHAGHPHVDGGAAPDARASEAAPSPDPALVDLNPDPRILEVSIDARVTPMSVVPGLTTAVWSYNGSLPGPLLRLRAGDRLIVHFTNHLPEPTSIHWHGLRIPADMDGVPDHPHPAVPPGGTFRYDFIVPDAGLFWYHPHANSADQMGKGLYGALLVDDPHEPPDSSAERVLVLSDMALQADGTFVPPDAGGSLGTLFGREGQHLLVNGQLRPRLEVAVGQRQRWRLVNAAKSRYFQLAAQGQRFLQVGVDGGRTAAPVEVERPVLIPGERLDLIWEPRGDPGTTLPVRWVPYDRGYGSTFNRPEVPLMDLALAAASAAPPAPLPAPGRPVAPLNLVGATPVSIRLTRNDVDKTFYLGINGKAFGGDDHIRARIGETQIWTVENELDFAHPFHIHGFFFQVLDEGGAPRQPLAWKDTVDVPARKKTQIAVKFDERPGMWMFHCHILDHADVGMMGMIMLEE